MRSSTLVRGGASDKLAIKTAPSNMAPSASKRRKLEHTSDDDGDDASFASFAESGDGGVHLATTSADGELPADDEDDVNDLSGSAREQDSEEEELEGENIGSDDERSASDIDEASTKPSPALSKPGPTPTDASARKRIGDGQTFTSGSFKSNVFKLQVDELLDQIRLRHSKREAAAEDALHKVKSTIDHIPSRPPLPVEDAVRRLLKSDKVMVPFPSPRPPKDAKYKLEYQKPANVNVAGSYALKTASRARDVLELDMVLTMPSAMFQEKDYLNHRYFYRRAYYLGCVAAGLKDTHAAAYDISFANLHDNALQPIVSVRPREKESKLQWRINILASLPTNAFPSDKLLPEKNCIRTADSHTPTNGLNELKMPTTFYNSSLRAEMLVTPYLKLLHSATKTCEAFQDACMLGNTWLRQRGLSSDMHAGGFGNFEWSALMALMLSGGGPKGTPILSSGYSSYQLFKATLQVLAVKDISKQPLVVGAGEYTPRPISGK